MSLVVKHKLIWNPHYDLKNKTTLHMFRNITTKIFVFLLPHAKNRHKHQCVQVIPSGELWTIFAFEILNCESTPFGIPEPAIQRAQQLTIHCLQFWIVHPNFAWKNNSGLGVSPCFTSRLMSNTKLLARALPNGWAYNRRSHWRYASVFQGLKQCVMFTLSVNQDWQTTLWIPKQTFCHVHFPNSSSHHQYHNPAEDKQKQYWLLFGTRNSVVLLQLLKVWPAVCAHDFWKKFEPS